MELIHAVEFNDLEKINNLIKGKNFNVNDTDDHGDTGFIYACYYGNLEIVKLLVNQCKNLNINLKNNDGDTGLMLACDGNNYKVIKFLLNNCEDIDVNLKNDNGESAVEEAKRKGHDEIVKLFE
jgi:ankyrin repeat protein